MYCVFIMRTLFLNAFFFFFASYRLVIIHLYYIFSVINVNSCSISTLEKSVSRYRFTNPLSLPVSGQKRLPNALSYGCESWTTKKAECQRIDAFELWCWRRRLRVPWTARRSNQSILKEISPGIFMGRTSADAEAPKLWPPDVKN